MNIFKSFYLFLIIVLLFSFSACQSDKKEQKAQQAPAQAETPVKESPTAAAKKKTRNPVYTQEEVALSTTKIGLSPAAMDYALTLYLQIKDRLVEDKPGIAHQLAFELNDLFLSEGGEKLSTALRSSVESLTSSKDIGLQREYFNTLSQEMYTLAKKSNARKHKIYKQFCPMAFDNIGAFWLSSEKEIMNPYFGDEMLHCGKVQEEL